jgi:hypothetical protein
MSCHCCGRPMRRVNPEPEAWIRWTPLHWCVSCHQFAIGAGDRNGQKPRLASAMADSRELIEVAR